MGARVSAKGITKFGFGKTDPTKQTSSNDEAAALIDTSKGVRDNAAQHPVEGHKGKAAGKSKGTKVSGATRTKGGAI